MTENEKTADSVRIASIWIENYKGIDSLELDFPPPEVDDDPDIMVLGSENGVGKTSILECCALLLLAAVSKDEDEFAERLELQIFDHDYLDILIRAGAKEFSIGGKVTLSRNLIIECKISMDKSGEIKHERNLLKEESNMPQQFQNIVLSEDNSILEDLLGFSVEPVIQPTFLFFHSYRKLPEARPELGDVSENNLPNGQPYRRRRRRGVRRASQASQASLKTILLLAMMDQASLFEIKSNQAIGDAPSKMVFQKFNELMKGFADGEVLKLRPSDEGALDFRVTRNSEEVSENSFSLDSLSSGQKEIISTLFLIWHQTLNNPRVVLIDEPEKHLNARWHKSFVRYLKEFTPKNQYVIASHSEYVFNAVDSDRQITLTR